MCRCRWRYARVSQAEPTPRFACVAHWHSSLVDIAQYAQDVKSGMKKKSGVLWVYEWFHDSRLPRISQARLHVYVFCSYAMIAFASCLCVYALILAFAFDAGTSGSANATTPHPDASVDVSYLCSSHSFGKGFGVQLVSLCAVHVCQSGHVYMYVSVCASILCPFVCICIYTNILSMFTFYYHIL